MSARSIVIDQMTQDWIKSVLNYEPSTGEITWRVSRSGLFAGSRAGYQHPEGYRYIKLNGYRFPSHRLAWFYMTGKWPAAFLDHINGTKDDNRWVNLREATNSQNQANRPLRRERFGFRGVCPKRGRWAASIKKNGQHYHLGTYDSAEEASAVYAAAAKNLFGEFARST